MPHQIQTVPLSPFEIKKYNKKENPRRSTFERDLNTQRQAKWKKHRVS
jgi:hypothetical protein